MSLQRVFYFHRCLRCLFLIVNSRSPLFADIQTPPFPLGCYYFCISNIVCGIAFKVGRVKMNVHCNYIILLQYVCVYLLKAMHVKTECVILCDMHIHHIASLRSVHWIWTSNPHASTAFNPRHGREALQKELTMVTTQHHTPARAESLDVSSTQTQGKQWGKAWQMANSLPVP